MAEAYDPLDYENLARSVVEGLMNQGEEPLPPGGSFEGCGVYAIYYKGGFEPYLAITRASPLPPIYVGKAVPIGARKGGRGAPSQGRELCTRLKQHAQSISQIRNLDLSDFYCRFLVVVPVWITLAERFLVEHYKPIWNVVIDGFGNHDPGAGRRAMKRPMWDILHPGRPWAAILAPQESQGDVITRLHEFLRKGS
jgi:hypothetical protein